MNQDILVSILSSVLIVKDDKFLLVNAKVGAPKGLWNNPGGHVDKGETYEECAKREAFEETGYTVDIGRLIGTYSWEREGKRSIKRVYETRIVDGSLNLPKDEIEEARWFSKDDIIDERLFTSGAVKSIQDYTKGRFNQTYEFDRII